MNLERDRIEEGEDVDEVEEEETLEAGRTTRTETAMMTMAEEDVRHHLKISLKIDQDHDLETCGINNPIIRIFGPIHKIRRESVSERRDMTMIATTTMASQV